MWTLQCKYVVGKGDRLVVFRRPMSRRAVLQYAYNIDLALEKFEIIIYRYVHVAREDFVKPPPLPLCNPRDKTD